MSAITLTIDAPFAEPVTRKIDAPSAKPLTQHRLELITEAVKAINLLPSELIEDLVNHIKNDCRATKISKAESDFAAKLGVEPISDQEQQQLEKAALRNFFELKQKLFRDSLTASEVAKLLGTKSRQTPHDRVKKNSLVAAQDNGVWKFPPWQFDPTGRDGVIAGLPDILKALDVPNFSKISWLTRPNPALNELTPVEALKRGQKDEVMALARAVGVL